MEKMLKMMQARSPTLTQVTPTPSEDPELEQQLRLKAKILKRSKEITKDAF
jgi:hypothetical protein